MLLFDYFFYALLISSSFLAYWILRKSSPTSRKLAKLAKGLGVLSCLVLWVWQLGLWILPKGSKWEEVVHLPRHLSTLSALSVPSVNSQKLVYGSDQKQYVQYFKATTNGPNANKIVFYLHGGGWHTGSPQQHLTLAKILLEKGYTVALAAYRLGPTNGYQAIREDVDQAFLTTLNYAKENGLTNPSIILGGTSAGGNLAGLLAYDDQRWSQLAVDRKHLKGIFSIVGVLNLDYMEETQVLKNYAGESTSSTFALANPINYITPTDSIPLLCLHGTKDGLVPVEGVKSFCEKIKTATTSPVELHTFPERTHLDIGAAWYYDSNKNYGQDSILVAWLDKL